MSLPGAHLLRMPAPVRRKLIFACLSLSALALVLTGAALAGAGRGAPPAESPNAAGIQDLYWIVLAVTGVVFVIVESALILFIVRFRSRGRERSVEGPQIRGHTRLELIWTAIPAVILAAIIAVVFYKLPGIKDVPEAGAAGPRMTVHVEGRQFYWRYTYPNGAVSINELVVPAQRPIYLVVTAPSFDVIHSWWVPELAGKMDAIPGKVNHTWFEAPRPGIYQGQCAEFCGIEHAMMLTHVRALTNSEYGSWVARQLHVSANIGRMTFEGACAPCHGLQGQGMIGPSLKGNATLADRQKLAQLLENGKRKMPPVGEGWSSKELASLMAYLKQEFASGG
jgi:cytochrome c oxidase subunit II